MISFLFLMVFGWNVWGQVAYAPEKVFLHLDRTYFAVGETIWMKGYVESIAPVPDTSRFLYVELIDWEGGETVLRNKIRLGDDGFAGYLDLPENMSGGRYMLRVYTRWQMNWPEEWMFHTLVDIYDGTEDESPEPETGQVDISFYPEGGRYFSERHATVGFKAMAADGKCVEWSGALYDDQGEKICDCRTEHAGMGLIGFTPKEGRRYRLVGGSGGHSWDLPGASKEGATMQLRKVGDYFAVHVINCTGASVMLQIRKGVECFTIAQVDSPERTLRVPISSSGLQKFILTDQDGLILSERSVFVEDGTMTAAIDVACPSPDYVPKQKWGLSLQLPDGSDIDSAVVSVSVVRSAFRNYQQEGNISSYMLLSSEINGFIENPDYYFDPDIPASLRMNHLDLLLLIQGWTYYDDEKIVSTVEYPKEQVQALMGEVKSVFKTRPKNFMLTWMAPELGFSQVTAVERGSRFVVDSLDFPDSTLFIVVVDKVRGTRSYYPVLEEDFAPKSDMLQMAIRAGRGKAAPSATPRSVVAADDYEPVFLPGDVEVDTIRTAVISAIAPRIRSPFGSSELSNIKEQKDFVAYGNYNLLSYILMTNVNLQRSGNDVINLNTGYLSELNPSKEGTEEEDAKYNKVSLFVNGVVTPWDMAESIMMGNVQKLSVTTTMNSDAFLARSFGGIVLVELLEGGMGVPQSLNQQVNTVVVRPLGWQRPKAFYNPVYDRRPTLSLPDRRNTVYWNPSVRIGATSPKEITVMTEDRADGPYFLRIEGRTSDGRWISTTKVLDAIF